MKLKILIFISFFSSILYGIDNGYVVIYGKKIDNCRERTIRTISNCLKTKNISYLSLLSRNDISIDTSIIRLYNDGIKNRKRFYEYHDSLNNFQYSLIFFKEKRGKRKYYLQLNILMDEDNPFVIKDIELTEKITIPKALKELFKELDSIKTPKKRITEIMWNRFRPRSPGIPCFEYENVKVSNTEIVYIYDYFLNDLRIEHLRDVDTVNIDMIVDIFLRTEYDIIPEMIRELNNLKKLKLRYSNKIKSEIVIPNFIGELKSLEELEIHCENCTSLPDSLLKLPNLKKIVFAGEKLNRKALELIERINTKLSGS